MLYKGLLNVYGHEGTLVGDSSSWMYCCIPSLAYTSLVSSLTNQTFDSYPKFRFVKSDGGLAQILAVAVLHFLLL